MLIRLIYASHSSRAIQAQDIRQILDASQRNNTHAGITGMLCHGDGRFLQILEGERVHISQTYARILQDERHERLMLLAYGEALPIFREWSMGYVSADDPETLTLIHRASGLIDFRPEEIGSEQAIELVRTLKNRLTPQIGFA